MLKALGNVSLKSIRPLLSNNTKLSLTPIVTTNLAKKDFHVSSIKQGGGDHEFIVNIKFYFKNKNKTLSFDISF